MTFHHEKLISKAHVLATDHTVLHKK